METSVSFNKKHFLFSVHFFFVHYYVIWGSFAQSNLVAIVDIDLQF
jgi:hypothetical protein